MNILIVYCHPSNESFTSKVKQEFIRGLTNAGHSYMLSDLYEMGFNAEFSEADYIREAFYRESLPLQEDVLREQEKIQAVDAIAFIYPVFWTEAPAKLVGWFDRVWTYGFAYGAAPKMKVLDKALFIVTAGKNVETLRETGEADAMKTVMLGDRIRNRAKDKNMVFLDGTSRWNMDTRNKNIKKHLKTAYELGAQF